MLLLALLSTTLSFASDTDTLLAGVHTLEARGLPGPLVVFGDRAFPVLTTERGEVVVAAARYGEGRVVAFGHGAYIDDSLPGTGGERLVANAVAWVAADARDPQVVRLTDSTSLAGVDVLTWAGEDLSEATRRQVRAFVEGGGGLVVGTCPWGWQQLNSDLSLREDASSNKVLAPMGLAFGPTYLPGPFPVADSRPDLAHAGLALSALHENSSESLRAIEEALQWLPSSERALMSRVDEVLRGHSDLHAPSEAAGLGPEDPFCRLRFYRQLRQWEEASEPPAAIQGAELFPGVAPEDAPRVTRAVSAEGTHTGWVSTGTWAQAGEVVTVKVRSGDPERWSVQIGAHTDQTGHHESWQRWPSVSRLFALEGAETEVASPFGGLVYLVPRGDEAEAIEVELAGVVDAPFFKLGETGDWEAARRAPAPWAEIAGEHITLTVPSAALEGLDDPARVARFWDAVVEAHYRLAARPVPARPERFVADVQISMGYMHSGYPIMTLLDVTRPADGHPLGLVLDVDQLEQSGSWGHFHELGHNCQREEWTFAGTEEVTVNLFSLHAMDRVVGLEPWRVPWLEAQKADARAYLDAGAPFEQWQRHPGVALMLYAQVQRAFGWEPIIAVMGEYEALPDAERPRTDEEKRDQWMIRLSRAVGRDLGPFFARWGVPVSAAARAEVADLEDWMPDFEDLSPAR